CWQEKDQTQETVRMSRGCAHRLASEQIAPVYAPERAEPAPSVAGERLLYPIDLALQVAGVPRTDVSLEHEGNPRTVGCDSLSGALHDIEDLIPFALDGREHGVRLIGESRLPHDADGRGDRLVDGIAPGWGAAARGDGESN